MLICDLRGYAGMHSAGLHAIDGDRERGIERERGEGDWIVAVVNCDASSYFLWLAATRGDRASSI